MNLGKRIENSLLELGWTQSKLLDKVPDLESATLSALIRRDSKHSRHTLEIAQALGLNPVWLQTGTGEQWAKPPTLDGLGTITPREAAILQSLRGLTQTQQDEIYRQIQEREKGNQEIIDELLALTSGRRRQG